jgi:uncharacterized protein
MTSTTTDSLILAEDWHIHYDYTSGPVTGRFLRSLADGRIEGIRCPQCELVWMPPRAYCERCFVPTTDWVQVGPHGIIEAATVITQQFVGAPHPPPYAIAFVRFDGADSALVNVLEFEIDPNDIAGAAAKITPGTAVVARFADQREGRMTDFHYELL